MVAGGANLVKLRKDVSYDYLINYIDKIGFSDYNKKKILEFLDYKKNELRQGKKTVMSNSTLKWYVSYFKIINSVMKKDYNKLTETDLTKIINKISELKISQRGKHNAIKGFRALLSYLELNINLKGFSISPIDDNKEEPLILTFEQIKKANELLMKKEEKIYAEKKIQEARKILQTRLLLILGSDFGGRPEEIYNIEKEHLVWDDKRKSYWVYCQYHKKRSKRRNIDIPFSTKIVNEYFQKNEMYLKMSDKEVNSTKLIDVNPAYATKLIRESLNLIGIADWKRFKLKSLRKASIQKYVELYKGNVPSLCARYGWSIKKAYERLEEYLARSKIRLPDGQDLRRQDEVEKVVLDYEGRLDSLKNQNEVLSNRLNTIERNMLNWLRMVKEKGF